MLLRHGVGRHRHVRDLFGALNRHFRGQFFNGVTRGLRRDPASLAHGFVFFQHDLQLIERRLLRFSRQGIHARRFVN